MLQKKNEIIEKGLVAIQEGQTELWTNSLAVAEVFGKEHKNIIRDIRESGEYFHGSNFSSENHSYDSSSENIFKIFEKKYINDRGQEQPFIVMNKPVFDFVVLGYSGQKAKEYKKQFIEKFYAMEMVLKEQQSKALVELKEKHHISQKAVFSHSAKIADMTKERVKLVDEIKALKDMKPDESIGQVLEGDLHFLYLQTGKYKNKPVCKIGITRRQPHIRLAENQLSYCRSLEINNVHLCETKEKALQMEKYFIELFNNYYETELPAAWAKELLPLHKDEALNLFNKTISKFNNVYTVCKFL